MVVPTVSVLISHGAWPIGLESCRKVDSASKFVFKNFEKPQFE